MFDDLSKRSDKLISKGNRLGSCWKSILLNELNNLIEGPEALEAWRKRISSIRQQSAVPPVTKKRKPNSNLSTFIQRSTSTQNTIAGLENTTNVATTSNLSNEPTSQSQQPPIVSSVPIVRILQQFFLL